MRPNIGIKKFRRSCANKEVDIPNSIKASFTSTTEKKMIGIVSLFVDDLHYAGNSELA